MIFAILRLGNGNRKQEKMLTAEKQKKYSFHKLLKGVGVNC